MKSLAEIVNIPTVTSDLGNLSFIQRSQPIPFQPRRIYYILGVPPEGVRGGHGHRNLSQLLVALNGSFSVDLDDGSKKETYFLNSPSEGLLVGPGLWREMRLFSVGAICLVAASEEYDELDYIRNYDEYLNWRLQ